MICTAVRISILSTLIAFFAPAVPADLVLAPNTKIVFGNDSTLSEAPTDVDVPAGHGGTGNTVLGTDAFVGGGTNNAVTAARGTIGGGGDTSSTTANKVTDAWGTVGGGRQNQAGDADGTSADRPYATVGGGWQNKASGEGATIPGGVGNEASGKNSFAAGTQARSTAQGAITFTDSLASNFTNNSPNSFAVRATGGVTFFTKVTSPAEGMSLDTSGNLVVSGAVQAEDFFFSSRQEGGTAVAPADGKALLEGVASLSIEEYVAADDGRGTARIGFAPEDFFSAFGLGQVAGGVNASDAHGVAFASIQALHGMVQERDRRIDELKAALDDVLVRLQSLEARFAR